MRFHDVWKGEACFLPPEGGLWSLRRATCRALHEGAEVLPFAVTREADYYPGVLDALLGDMEKLRHELRPYRDEMSGGEGEALRCVALWEMGRRTGALLHQSGDEIRAAFLPLLTVDAVAREREAARRLRALAQEAEDVPLQLERPIPPGVWRLSELLQGLSDRLDS